MKNLAAIVIVLMGIPAFGQLSKNIDSKISNVTVFLNRAQVTREGRVRIEAGQNHLLLKGLPSKIDPQSIQVSGKGNYILLGVNHRHNYLDDMTAPKPLKVLKDSIEILNRSLSLDQSQKEILNREEQLLLANQKFGGTNQSISVSEMKAMADFYRSRLMEITTSRMKVDENMKQKQLRIAKLQQQSFELSNVMNRNTSEIGITLSSQAAASIDLIITYVVPDAGWQPVYDLRAKDTRSPISLSYKANVYQNTGEEWKDVKLSLSTANPNLSGLKPELATWFLDFYAPVAIQYKKQKPMPSAVRGESMAAADISEEEIAPETIADYLETVQTTLNTEFRISLPYTVESSSKPTSVDISNSEIKANYKYAATPKMESDAFLMAYATQWEDLNLLPGLANIFLREPMLGKHLLIRLLFVIR
ncbi:MAG: mucoidy inhibitor MuiA family protein [Flammeovirgaceae bacterium]|nr:mucoidy inhibitor MuiA family protein [Flammeovirgaceae bacterium]